MSVSEQNCLWKSLWAGIGRTLRDFADTKPLRPTCSFSAVFVNPLESQRELSSETLEFLTTNFPQIIYADHTMKLKFENTRERWQKFHDLSRSKNKFPDNSWHLLVFFLKFSSVPQGQTLSNQPVKKQLLKPHFPSQIGFTKKVLTSSLSDRRNTTVTFRSAHVVDANKKKCVANLPWVQHMPSLLAKDCFMTKVKWKENNYIHWGLSVTFFIIILSSCQFPTININKNQLNIFVSKHCAVF